MQKRVTNESEISTAQEQKKRQIARGKSEDYRQLCEKLMEAKKKTAHLQSQYNDVKETLQANYLNYNKPFAEPEQPAAPAQFPHCSQTRDEQAKFAKLAASQQQDYLGVHSKSRRLNENKKMSSFIDQCLLPVVQQPQQNQGVDSLLKRSRNR